MLVRTLSLFPSQIAPSGINSVFELLMHTHGSRLPHHVGTKFCHHQILLSFILQWQLLHGMPSGLWLESTAVELAGERSDLATIVDAESCGEELIPTVLAHCCTLTRQLPISKQVAQDNAALLLHSLSLIPCQFVFQQIEWSLLHDDCVQCVGHS